jgi:hypothetical protein
MAYMDCNTCTSQMRGFGLQPRVYASSGVAEQDSRGTEVVLVGGFVRSVRITSRRSSIFESLLWTW